MKTLYSSAALSPSGNRKKLITAKGIQIFLLLLPGLLIFGMFTIYPILKLLVMSFYDWHIGVKQVSPFVGLKNYIDVLSDPVFQKAFINTLVYGLVTVPGQIIIGLLIATLMSYIDRFKITFRVMYYLPVITSWVIVSLVFRYIFNNEGLINYFLKDLLHIINENYRWLDKPATGLFVAELLGIWKGIGWNVVVFLAALQAVPEEIYEVADIDGCGNIKKFFYITLPSIKNTMLFALVMLSIGAFNVFTSINLMTGGEPAHQTEVVLTWMYYKAFQAMDLGYASALSYIVAIVICVISVFQFKFFKSSDAK